MMMTEGGGAYDLPELPLEKVSISGPLMSSLLQRFAASGGDCDGLLFGHIRQLSAPKLQDDYDSFADSSAAVAEKIAASITGYVCSGSPQSFYDAVGRLHLPTLDKFLSQEGQPELDGAASSTASSGLIGWFVGRRNTQLCPSMREHAVSSSLFDFSPFKKKLSSGRQSGPPRVFLLLSGSFSSQTPIHTHEYRAFEFFRRGSFIPKSVDIVNVGPGFRGHYDVFCPISSFSWLSVDAQGRGEEAAGANCKSNHSRIEGENALEAMERMSSRLIGAESVNYTAELEDLYRRMLFKLENLSREVELSSAVLLEQMVDQGRKGKNVVRINDNQCDNAQPPPESDSKFFGSHEGHVYVTKTQSLWKGIEVVTKDKSSGGNIRFVCLFCNGSFVGSYSRVKAHLLKLVGYGIQAFNKIPAEKYREFKRLQDRADELLKVKSMSMSEKSTSVDVDKKRKTYDNQKTLQSCFMARERSESDKLAGNWSTYAHIHTIKRNKLQSKHVQKT